MMETNFLAEIVPIVADNYKDLPDDILFGDGVELLNYVVKQFKTVKDYNHWLNEAAEMM